MNGPSFRPHQVQRRQSSPDFDTHKFWMFYNEDFPNVTLSYEATEEDSDGRIMVVQEGTRSSSNWQIYRQRGRYFIRNYDAGWGWQLGLNETSASEPILMKTSGSLEQQWIFTRQTDGMYIITNGWKGNDSFLALSAMSGANNIPGMQPSKKGAVWDIVLNPSAPSFEFPGAYEDLKDFEVEEVPTSTLQSTSTPSTSSTVSIPPTQSHVTENLPNHTSGSRQILAPGAIAGIAIAGFCALLCLIFSGLYFWRRRAKKRTIEKPRPKYEDCAELSPDSIPAELHSPTALPPKELYAQSAMGPQRVEIG